MIYMISGILFHNIPFTMYSDNSAEDFSGFSRFAAGNSIVFAQEEFEGYYA